MSYLRLSLLILSLFVLSSVGQEITDFQYINIGGNGSYNEVTNMLTNAWPPPCTITNNCIKAPRYVNSPLAPFDDDLTFVFRGPMRLYQVAVYSPQGTTGDWSRVAYWDQLSNQNITWLANVGGGAVGEWTLCGGNSQAYVNANGTGQSPKPVPLTGYLETDTEVSIMSTTPCDASCGKYYRPVALKGWSGRKVFVTRVLMPNAGRPKKSGDSNYNLPAIWSLNGRIVRTAQYGCNCHGVTGNCGELDIAEVIPANSSRCISQIYYFNRTTGTGAKYFARPFNTPVVFVTIFDNGSIRVFKLPDWTFPGTLTAATFSQWSSRPATTASPYLRARSENSSLLKNSKRANLISKILNHMKRST